MGRQAPSVVDWPARGLALVASRRGASSFQWALADWVASGNPRRGDLIRIADEVGVAYQTLRNQRYVARRFPPARRCAALSFTHHAAAAALPAPVADHLLREAAAGGWTVPRLRTAARAAAREQLQRRNAAVTAALEARHG